MAPTPAFARAWRPCRVRAAPADTLLQPVERPFLQLPDTLHRMGTPRDFRADLLEQIDFLQASIDRFDTGHHHEAKRIATVVRVLLYESGQTPLLRELGARDEIDWLSFGSPFEPRNLAVTNSLVAMSTDFAGEAGFESLATISAEPPPWARWIDFTSWWSGEPVINNPRSKISFTRRNLVLMLANRDGGAHVGRLSASERQLTEGKVTAWAVDFGQGVVDVMDSPVPASLRTMGAEVLATLSKHRETMGV